MEENTQLPPSIEVEIEKRMLELIPPELCFEGDQTYDLAASKRYEVENVIVAYATKLHQANETIKVLEYDNNKLKGQVEGLTSAVEELKGENQKLKATATGWRPLLEDILRDNNNGYIDIDEALCSRIKTFLYGE